MGFSRTSSAAAVGIAVMLAAGAAQAQSMSASSGSFNAGYGRTPGQENQPVNPTTRDANGNRVIIDGVMQIGSDQSSYARTGSFGAADSVAGAGAVGGATAIGNLLSVVVQGSWNTVIVNSDQTNNGDINAGTELNGGVDLDD